MNGVQPRSSATVLAWAISQAAQSDTPTYSTLPLRDEVVERAHDLLHRGEVVPGVHPEDVQPVGAQPPEAGLHGLHQVLAVVAAGVDVAGPGGAGVLAGQDERVPPVLVQQLPEHGLGGTGRVDVGRVHEVPARLQVGVENPTGGLPYGRVAGFVAAQGHGAQRQLADAQPGPAEECVPHEGPFARPPPRGDGPAPGDARGALTPRRLRAGAHFRATATPIGRRHHRVRGMMRTVAVVDRSGAKHDRLSRFTAMVLPRRTEGLTFSIHAPIYVRRNRVEAL